MALEFKQSDEKSSFNKELSSKIREEFYYPTTIHTVLAKNLKQSNPPKNRTSIKQLIKDTIGNETAQALIRMFETKNKGLKVFWSLCLLLCGTLCGYLLLQALMTYLSYPVYTTNIIVQEIPTKFPKITFCK